jgi:hypothetical protein
MKYLLLITLMFGTCTADTALDKQCKDAGYVKPKHKAKRKHKKIVKKKEVVGPDEIHTVVVIERTIENTRKNRLLITAHKRITGVDGSSGLETTSSGQHAFAESSTSQSIVPGITYIRDLGRIDALIGVDLKGELQFGLGVNF